ncbi:MAG TPA: 2-amino-4-hydroxy-6-hydroxymethyldihydropteridine diphosphokinase [Actinomycetota bacterium]
MGAAVRAFLGLGSNLGDRLGALQSAVDLLAAVPGVRVVRSSRVYETEPVGPRQPDYLNAVVEVATVLSPRELLDACLEVERRLGRVRRERWGPRTIDVDVLTYGDREVDEPGLEVPHPRMHERGFVLAPLLELAADPMLPGGRRVATLRPGPGSLRGIRPFAPPLPAPAGRPGGGPGILGAMDVAVIGAGRVGIALAVLLARAGHHIVAVSGGDATRDRAERFLPGVPVTEAGDAARRADLVLLGVPDAAIAEAARAVAGAVRPGAWVAHLSGAQGLEPLRAAEDAGARILALHPLQTFPTVEAALDRMAGSAVAVTARDEEGSALGERIARDLGGRPFRMPEEDRALYHAGAVLASNDLIALMALAEDVLSAAGIDDALHAFLPLARASLENAAEMGPASALTGPVVRGDAATVERNLRALSERAPNAVAAYAVLARAAAALAAGAGRLDDAGREAVEEVLDRWAPP